MVLQGSHSLPCCWACRVVSWCHSSTRCAINCGSRMVQNPSVQLILSGCFLVSFLTRGVRAISLVHFWCSFADGDELRLLVRSDCTSKWQSLKAVSDVPFSGGCRLMGCWHGQASIRRLFGGHLLWGRCWSMDYSIWPSGL